MKPLSRREFFRTSAFVALGAFVAACTKKATPSGKTGTTLSDVMKGKQQTLQMNTAGFEVLSNKPDRLVFNLIDPMNGVAVTAPSANLWIARDQRSQAITAQATYRDEGLPAEKGFYEAPISMPGDGTWLVVVQAQRLPGREPEFGAAQFQVGVQNAMPKTGDPAVVFPTPTPNNHRGVNPICTRKPPCSLHAVSLDKALANGKPTLLIIATPQFCQSALCGPEVDVVMAISKEFTGRANFIHVEVYRDNKPDTIQRQILAPAAQAWRLEQEPVLYYIGADKVIKARTVGPADKTDVRDAVTALLA